MTKNGPDISSKIWRWRFFPSNAVTPFAWVDTSKNQKLTLVFFQHCFNVFDDNIQIWREYTKCKQTWILPRVI
jgi:hypothetical protein